MHNNSDAEKMVSYEELVLTERLRKIKNKIIVLSGKGGVGKSTVSANLAMSLALSGFKTGLLDIDIHGPSIPILLGIENERLQIVNQTIFPYKYGENLKVISIGFLLQDKDTAVVWRGPAKMNLIRQFMLEVNWGELDYLIVDCPPGTGDEPLSIVQILEKPTGAVIVSTPQRLAIADVKKSIEFCHLLKLAVIGVVENMSGLICPDCGKSIDIFKSNGAQQMSQEMNIPFLGKIPIDPAIVEAGDKGIPFISLYAHTDTAKNMVDIIEKITKFKKETEITKMRFAIPTASGKLCQHFGHCEVFTFIDVDEETKTITKVETIEPPEHQPGIIPPWVAQQGAQIVLAGGMGGRAQQLFAEHGLKLIVGIPSEEPEQIVMNYLNKTLVTGVNTCDHSGCGSH